MLKTVLSLVANVGVGQVISNIVNSNTPDNLSKSAKVATKVGGIVVSGIMGGLATKYVSDQLNAVEDMANSLKRDSKED